MQDRFKFRFFDKQKNKMMDCYAFSESSTYASVPVGEITEFSCRPTENCELMQCTGLKDKNDKLIYEGDIVKITRENWTKERYNRFYIVCWDRTQWQLGLIKYQRPKAQPNRRPDRKMPFKNIVSFADYTPLKEFALCKVIGNFYENPELLESN